MKKLPTLIKCCFAAVALVFAPAAMSADYEVRKYKGECYHNKKFAAPLQHCHNCRKAGGNQIVWTFHVFCEGKRTEKIVRSRLQCGKSIRDEGDESHEMYEQAKEIMDDNLQTLAGWRDCNLGGWK